ncbi:hypothetical protein [Anaerolinea thermophila]|uniref:Hypothetical membrane protein n=2 Tax=Anaerolinea TaxID=233189 RepID=E8MZW1_ANATU|nr:hypothetical protein [Anaerolinea thermophila]BAJ62296.1 hypothetical membrane protein [Anaerolinea thermophila UNI-1]
MYAFLLPLHNILRWLLLIAALFAVGRALWGWLARKPWQALDDRAGLIFTTVMDLQVLVGLLLYVAFSPLTQTAFQNFGGAMGNATMRFFAIEHILIMVIALVLAHIGRAQARKASEALSKHRRAAIWFGIALLLVLLAIPWPFSGVPRPLWRWF